MRLCENQSTESHSGDSVRSQKVTQNSLRVLFRRLCETPIIFLSVLPILFQMHQKVYSLSDQSESRLMFLLHPVDES